MHARVSIFVVLSVVLMNLLIHQELFGFRNQIDVGWKEEVASILPLSHRNLVEVLHLNCQTIPAPYN